MAYAASEARQQLLDTLAEATDELGSPLACLAEAYDNLDVHNAHRLEQELFRPAQAAYGRAELSHAEFADRHGLPGRTFEQQLAGVSPTGATGFIQRAVEAIGEADRAHTRLQDSMLPVEVSGAAVRSGLAEVRDRYADFPSGPASCCARWAAERWCWRLASVAAGLAASSLPRAQTDHGDLEAARSEPAPPHATISPAPRRATGAR
jgi:hypothetical protein